MNEVKNDKTKSRIPYFFIIFFAVIFAVNAFYIYIAKKSWRGIYTENSYQKGLEYNQTLEYVKLQKKLGWKLIINFTNQQKNSGQMEVCLFDQNNNHIKSAKITANITRPTQEGYDFQQELIPQNNCYFTKISFPLKGLWNIEIIANNDGKILQEVKRYVVQ